MQTLQNLQTPQIASCMGQQPMFAMSHLPMRPTPASFQQAFPLAAPGYMLAYPMRGHFGRSIPQTPMGPPIEVFNMNTAQSTPSLQASSSIESSMDFDDMCFDIGNAFVASDGPDGWHQVSNEHDASMNFPSISPPSTFDPAVWNVNMNMPTPTSLDLSSPPILSQIEPNFLDPTPDMSNTPMSNPPCPSCSSRTPAPAASIQTANDIPHLYVNPGAYLSPPAHIRSPHDMIDDSWRLQAL